MVCKKCGGIFKCFVTIDGKLRNLCKRKFCLACSPFGKHNTKNLQYTYQEQVQKGLLDSINPPTSPYGSLPNVSTWSTKTKGELAEAKILSRCLQRGWVVLQPFGDNQRYDLVIDRGNGFERIQVKTGRVKKGTILVSLTSSFGHRFKGRSNYKGQCDLFAIYCNDNDKTYMTSVDKHNTSLSLRLIKPSNNQAKKILWAQSFEF